MKYCIQLVHILKIIGTPSKRSTQMWLNSYTKVWEIPFAMSINKPLEKITPTFFQAFRLMEKLTIQPSDTTCTCMPNNSFLCKVFAQSEWSYGCLITIFNYFVIFKKYIMCFPPTRSLLQVCLHWFSKKIVEISSYFAILSYSHHP